MVDRWAYDLARNANIAGPPRPKWGFASEGGKRPCFDLASLLESVEPNICTRTGVNSSRTYKWLKASEQVSTVEGRLRALPENPRTGQWSIQQRPESLVVRGLNDSEREELKSWVRDAVRVYSETIMVP